MKVTWIMIFFCACVLTGMLLTRWIGVRYWRCNSRIVIDFRWSNIILLFVTGSYVCGVVLCICFLVLCLFIYLFIVFPVGPRIYKVIPLMMWYVYSRGFGSWVRISHWEFNGTRCLSYLIRRAWEYLEPRGKGCLNCDASRLRVRLSCFRWVLLLILLAIWSIM